MVTMRLDQQQSINVLTLINGEQDNVLNQDVLNEYIEVFDEIERHSDNACLVIQSDHPKTFAMVWILHGSCSNPCKIKKPLPYNWKICCCVWPCSTCLSLQKLMVMPMLVAQFWHRLVIFGLLRADKGRFCFPEVKTDHSLY